MTNSSLLRYPEAGKQRLNAGRDVQRPFSESRQWVMEAEGEAGMERRGSHYTEAAQQSGFG